MKSLAELCGRNPNLTELCLIIHGFEKSHGESAWNMLVIKGPEKCHLEWIIEKCNEPFKKRAQILLEELKK